VATISKAVPIRDARVWRSPIDVTGAGPQLRRLLVRKDPITVVGAGIVGLWQALTLARGGLRVRLVEASADPFVRSSSRWAGAMIAPECEAEGAPSVVRDLGRHGLALWQKHYDKTVSNGTIVVAPSRDAPDLVRFGRMTERHRSLSGVELAELEPSLSGRFERGLYFESEAHVDALEAMGALLGEARRLGVEVALGIRWDGPSAGVTIDCRGMLAREDIAHLRGVRGERVRVAAPDVSLSRPVRLLHPRQPIYVVPQGQSQYVIGASLIEREDDGPMTLKSALDLLGSAYALNPAFSEAAILDMGAGVRPAFPDNVPRILIEDDGRTIRVNGAYRHGFLLAPVLAEAVLAFLSDGRRDVAFFSPL
jgi:glycine oxidase